MAYPKRDAPPPAVNRLLREAERYATPPKSTLLRGIRMKEQGADSPGTTTTETGRV